ncbi:MAG: hypothetical protein IT260_13855 [Saprospiraceae bacterium]|nr:hypothetical protein [Saprospiraceae bacterium]
MNQPAEFFDKFSPTSKIDWLERIAKDLKGKPLEELHWQLNAQIKVDPFGHADDFPSPSLPLHSAPSGWAINEDIESTDPEAANAQALEALSAGASSLHFPLKNADLEATLAGVYLDYISLHFSGQAIQDGPAAVLAALGRLAAAQQIPAAALRGSLYYDPAGGPGEIRDWRYVLELLAYAGAEFPGIRCLRVDGRPDFQGTEGVVDELVALLHKGQGYLEQLSVRGANPQAVAAQMQFSCSIGQSYFVEIAKLRAFKLLWINVLNAWGVVPAYPVLEVRFAPGAYTDALYSNMIRATTMAMSAVLGGADRLTVLPYDAGREAQAAYPPAFARRIARNVQHLLQLESGLGDVADPAAGSYYLEKLTAQLAEAAWNKFK